ncbi:MAG TPA: alpha,alpha-trehalase TreF [Magnetospirillaceae bacterium]|nr:alpha,alpha-trehalase TreF [Magnetospirillaceae bacterium]
MPVFHKKITHTLARARISLAPKRAAPDVIWDELFRDVQLRRIFPDSITFADMVPAQTKRHIMKIYTTQRHDSDFDLSYFVKHHFQGLLKEDYVTNPRHSVEEHIEELWDVLRRDVPKNVGSLVGLPYPYVVAGGRYIAQFYWDSYFTMLGLAASGRWDMVENMVKNCAYSIRKFGFVPNGNRTYYLTRSQPPVFALMVRLLATNQGSKRTLVRFLPHLLKEYRFWMRGSGRLNHNKTTFQRVVRMPDGSVLNRYWDTVATPRPEGYKEDVAIALQATRPASRVYLDIRAAAESGWDFSSRWLADGRSLSTIHTTDIIPVDLNSLLFTLEETIADAYDALLQKGVANRFRQAAVRRQTAINTYCWKDSEAFYHDFDFVTGAPTPIQSIAAAWPLFAGIASQEQADGVAHKITTRFLQRGGVVTSLTKSGQQWDWPNGWPPHQWAAIQGLRHYGHLFLADEIKQRWVTMNADLYKATGKLVEKHNVVDTSQPALNGEYALQDGFGWTNGILLALLREERP